MTAPLFVRACRGERIERTPVWLMRQAGRYMPEYRELAERHGFMAIVKNPELACQVTLQPIEAFGMDAAVIFSDITPLLEDMGLGVQIVKGEGPVVVPPVRTEADVRRLRVPEEEELMPYTTRAIVLARRELADRRVPVLGFSGAPFTLAAYAIEGGRSSTFAATRALMLNSPEVWADLMNKLATVVGRYLRAQARAGAEALQVFDTWAGCLSQRDYESMVLPYTKKAIALAAPSGVPLVNFALGTGTFLDTVGEAGGQVLGLDWRVDAGEACARFKGRFGIQGNLDPAVLLGPEPEVRRQVAAALAAVSARNPGRVGYVFNLGHGILPQTPPGNVRALVETVKSTPMA